MDVQQRQLLFLSESREATTFGGNGKRINILGADKNFHKANLLCGTVENRERKTCGVEVQDAEGVKTDIRREMV